MKTFLQSLSLGSSAAIVAGVSALITAVWCWSCRGKLAWLIAVLVPLIASFCLYWAPVWAGANSAEYSAWAALGVGVPFLIGAAASGLVLLLFRRQRGS